MQVPNRSSIGRVLALMAMTRDGGFTAHLTTSHAPP